MVIYTYPHPPPVKYLGQETQNTENVLKLCFLEEIEFSSNLVKLNRILIIFTRQIVLTVRFILVKTFVCNY